MPFRQQVIVAVPGAAESRTIVSWLESEGFEAMTHTTAKSAADAILSQPFDLLIADSAFVLTGGVRGFGLARFRETPVIVIGDAAGGRSCAPLGSQIMFLERPLDRDVFICTVTMALMDARPERRSPRKAVRPFEATVNGVPSQIIDVSREGVRLELPRDKKMVTPHFVLRVPLIGVGVSVQRRWVRMPRTDESIEMMWCGGELGQNTAVAEQGWQRFIDTLVSAVSSPN